MSADKMRINEMNFEAASLFWPLISFLSRPDEAAPPRVSLRRGQLHHGG